MTNPPTTHEILHDLRRNFHFAVDPHPGFTPGFEFNERTTQRVVSTPTGPILQHGLACLHPVVLDAIRYQETAGKRMGRLSRDDLPLAWHTAYEAAFATWWYDQDHALHVRTYSPVEPSRETKIAEIFTLYPETDTTDDLF